MSERPESKEKIENDDKVVHAHKLAGLLLRDCDPVKEVSCPLKEYLKKSFAERVLYLEEQAREELERMLSRCESCGKYKNEIKIA